MKRLLSAVLALCLLCACAPAPAMGGTTQSTTITTVEATTVTTAIETTTSASATTTQPTTSRPYSTTIIKLPTFTTTTTATTTTTTTRITTTTKPQTPVLRVLSIGNSYSQDAHHFLSALAAHEGREIRTVNLFYSGCSLKKHYEFYQNNEDAYNYEINGKTNWNSHVGLVDILKSEPWDIITFHEASYASCKGDSVQPYLNLLIEVVRKHAPNAKLYLHQTWAYEAKSRRLCEELHYETPAQMLADLKASYAKAAQEIDADGVIPAGEVMYRALELGAPTVHRDTFHAGLGLGRYLLGLTWYGVLTGRDTDTVVYSDFDAPVSAQELAIAHQAVRDVIK